VAVGIGSVVTATSSIKVSTDIDTLMLDGTATKTISNSISPVASHHPQLRLIMMYDCMTHNLIAHSVHSMRHTSPKTTTTAPVKKKGMKMRRQIDLIE
jgi:hypothetical protein